MGHARGSGPSISLVAFSERFRATLTAVGIRTGTHPAVLAQLQSAHRALLPLAERGMLEPLYPEETGADCATSSPSIWNIITENDYMRPEWHGD